MAAQNAEMTSSTIDLTACVKEQDKILMAQAKVFKLDLFKIIYFSSHLKLKESKLFSLVYLSIIELCYHEN